MSATNNVPEQILMSWLGHRDSKMVRHYYHLHDGPSQEHMARTEFFTMPPERMHPPDTMLSMACPRRRSCPT